MNRSQAKIGYARTSTSDQNLDAQIAALRMAGCGMIRTEQKSGATLDGLTVEGGELSDIDLRHGFDIEFSVGIPMDDGSLYSVDRALFEVLAEPFGLKPSDYGRIFRTGGETFRITAINPNRPKYPISAERLADGRGYKFTVENIEMYLKAAEH